MKKKILCLVAVCTLMLNGCGTNENPVSGDSTENISTENVSTESTSTEEVSTEDVSMESVSTESASAEEPVTTLNQDTYINISNVSEIADNFYAEATNLPASEVEEYANVIKKLVLDEEWEALASEISYPITMAGLTIEDATGFTDLIADNQITEEFVAAIEAETCQEMFSNWQGISMGAEGQIWIAAVQNEQGEFELKITGINGMLVE